MIQKIRQSSPSQTPWCATSNGYKNCAIQQCTTNRDFSSNRDFNGNRDFGSSRQSTFNNRQMYRQNTRHYSNSDNEDCWGQSKNHYLGTETSSNCINWNSPKVIS